MKTLILYATCNGEKYDLRIKKFIRDGIFDDPDVKFVIIYNGECPECVRNLIPNYVLLVERENIGFDFGAWSRVILGKDIIDYLDYDNFIFLNGSVYGPCLPAYLDKSEWVKCFTSKLNSRIKLVGCTINYNHDLHMQSYCWCTDKIFLRILIEENYFNVENTDLDKQFYILNYEIQNIKILKKYNYDYFTFQHFRKYHKGIHTNNLTNNCRHVEFLKTNINPLEVMFVKPDLNEDNSQWLDYLEYDNA